MVDLSHTSRHTYCASSDTFLVKGTVDVKELAKLAKLLHQHWTKRDVSKYFERMVAMEKASKGRRREEVELSDPANEEPEQVQRETFVLWWMNYQRDVRRKLLSESMKLFENEQHHRGKAGLDAKHFNNVLNNLIHRSPNFKCLPAGTLDPAFDSRNTFGSVPKADHGIITMDEFEDWWGSQVGYDGADIPILPEHMAQKIADAAGTDNLWPEGQLSNRSGKMLWRYMGVRLRLLVSFEAIWGQFSEIYPMFLVSRVEEEGPMPHSIIDPDTTFSVRCPSTFGGGGGVALVHRNAIMYAFHFW